MTLKIEVGDKVRIVNHDKDYPHIGKTGEVGKVLNAEGRCCEVEGVGASLPVGKGWWRLSKDLALFADELEDMPPDTWVTYGSTSCFSITNGTTTRCSRPKKGPQ